ncbi:helix-loop-helix DNA-binding domain-containing protein [Ditylenchus destructor]|uniref:Helix-loop-helix DNA-binding domain-containing protein n=1 Tax=Ditylenchus destructor TaxID=166010 RepID=A0AAD4NBI1_9BILA|nr:helix-loop-helix DNA-binding domain-containing protein [Ditylenchus destructor]
MTPMTSTCAYQTTREITNNSIQSNPTSVSLSPIETHILQRPVIISTSTEERKLSTQTNMSGGYRKRKHRGRGRSYVISTSPNSDNEFSDVDDDEGESKKSQSGSPSVDEDRRAHHNELERRRRDHIKDHFMNLKNSIPLLEGEKSSRALILKRAVDYISLLQAQLKEYRKEVEDMRRQKEILTMAKHHAVAAAYSAAACSVKSHQTFVHPQLPSPILPTIIGQQNQSQSISHNQMSAFFGSNQIPNSSPNSSPPFPFSVTATSPSTSSTAMSNSISPSSLLPPLNSPVTNLATSMADGMKVASESTTAPSQQINGFLSSLLMQNHPILSQLQFQQQQQNQCGVTSAVECESMPNAGANFSPEMQLPQHISGLLNTSDAHARQLLMNSLALRERQLAAATMSSSIGPAQPQIADVSQM